MAATNDPEKLFPELPEDLTALSDEELDTLLAEHNVAADLIDANDEEFTKDISGADLLAQYSAGVEQIESIQSEQKARLDAEQAFEAEKAALSERRKSVAVDEAEEEPSEETDAEPLAAEDESEEGSDDSGNAESEEEEEEATRAEKVAVTAAAEGNGNAAVRLRRPPAATAARLPKADSMAVLTAASGVEGTRPGQSIAGRHELADAMKKTADRWGRVSKHENGVEQRILIANATYRFPEDRILHPSDWAANSDKLAKVLPAGVPGMNGVPLETALVASGGLCAPLEPIYTMPNFATLQRPVRDALPSFQASRGGVNVPAATFVGDITTAITTITEANDALGGTFATKSCQDLTCPAYTETAVTVISHCREYGNLNSMAWPEKIAHENDLTMAAHARTAEGYLLDRIKAQSINVTNGAETLGALIYLVDAIVKARFGIMGRLRMSPDARFRALLPAVLPGLLQLDTIQTPNEGRFSSKEQLVAYLRSAGIEPTFYLDTPSTGTTQLPDAAQTAAAIDGLPDTIQWAIFPEGAFIHVDSGSLELGIVRDSTLNSTNDYQIFGETFENVALVGPAQSAYWVTSDLCASGQFPPAGTVRTCD